MSLFTYIKSSIKEFVISWNLGHGYNDTIYSVASMALYLVFFSCLATIAMAIWKIFDHIIQFPIFYSKEHVKIIETHPREIGFVL